LSVTEIKGLDPSIEDLILHLKGINVILGLFAKDDHSKINMAIDASQCVVIMERIVLSLQLRDQALLIQ
jgi:hypothetical protein